MMVVLWCVLIFLFSHANLMVNDKSHKMSIVYVQKVNSIRHNISITYFKNMVCVIQYCELFELSNDIACLAFYISFIFSVGSEKVYNR